jgi:hypothetical protein
MFPTCFSITSLRRRNHSASGLTAAKQLDSNSRAAAVIVNTHEERQKAVEQASAAELQKTKDQDEAEKMLAVQAAAEAAREELRNEFDEEKRRRAHSVARKVINSMKGVIV